MSFVVFPKFLRPSSEVVSDSFKLKQICSYDSLDYLFIGSSYVYSGIDVACFDSIKKKAINLSMATSGPYFTKLLCDNYFLSCTKKPNTIFINLCLNNFSELASDAWDKYPLHALSSPPLSEELILKDFCDISMYFKVKRKQIFEGRLRREALAANVKNQIAEEISKYKGFVPSSEKYNTEVYIKTAKFYKPYKEEIFSRKKKDFFLAHLQSLKKMNLKIQLIEIPTFKLKEFYSPEYLVQYEDFIKEVNVSSGLKVIRFNEKLNDSLFRNIDHLNQFGAKVYTQFLIREIDKYSGKNL